ncbi:MAG: dTDP-glucose 4,6-dehydratase [Gammaproteobacteria bacterium]|nr:dTDP-glucose 4,6-dehydratase [Gammaproteobacteria bacterium]MDH5305500.1 dTDP-glucose 4,6-dehydratase [Gammaproteobacteria bacterium]MDH5322732.1 dTDP-glucose 4,6-dehydratase [Gammaproteobacteria bacterium]
MTVLVTGGAGFIGANFVLEWLAGSDETVVNIDKLSYAGNLKSLATVLHDPRHVFAQTDIIDSAAVRKLMDLHRPRAIVHFAAESHVDRSILGPDDFVSTNVVGTFHLLEEARRYHAAAADAERRDFRFINVSTDEVYGSLAPDDAPFSETHPYRPNSPYSASKAAADHLARSFFHTYGLPVITTNCSNNYGPLQFPEKLIPLMILNALRGASLPIYGDGLNVRDWLYVADHCAAIRLVLKHGRPGETYNIGGDAQLANINLVEKLCELLDELAPNPAIAAHKQLISYVPDRPGHDRRYAIDSSKIRRELGWQPSETFSSGLRRTVSWYLQNQDWIADIESGDYRHWIEANYGNRARQR